MIPGNGMEAGEVYRIVYRESAEQWDVMLDGEPRSVASGATVSDALFMARKRVRPGTSAIAIVYGRDGSIETQHRLE